MHVGIAASEGLISTKVDEDIYGRHWQVTGIGQKIKGEMDGVLKEMFSRNYTCH